MTNTSNLASNMSLPIAEQVSFADKAIVESCRTEVSDIVSYMMQFDPELLYCARCVSREWYWGCTDYLQQTDIIEQAAVLHNTRKLWLNAAPTTVRGAALAVRLHKRQTFAQYYQLMSNENFPIRDCLAMLLGNPQQSFEECYRLAYNITLRKHLTVDNFDMLLRAYYAVGTHDPEQAKMCAGFLMYSFRTIQNNDDGEAWVLTLLL